MRNVRAALNIFFLACIAFAPAGVHAWYDSDYDYCRELTITAGGASGGVATTTTAGFALVATSTISSLRTTGNGGTITQTSTASGTTTPVDVIITDGTECNSDGGSTVLDFYFEKYVPTTGEFVLWSEPIGISSTTPTTVLMYYGNSGASDLSDEAGVFGASGEQGVWNLHEDPSSVGAGGILDSTANNNDGTDGGSMNAADLVAGMVDGAFDFDNTDDLITVSDNASLDITAQLTVSAWVRKPALSGVDGVIAKGTSPTLMNYDFHTWDDELEFYYYTGGVDRSRNTSSANLQTNTWYYIVATYNDAANSLLLYVNGTSRATADINSPATNSLTANNSAFIIGEAINGSPTNGLIDDARVYNRALHSMDILTIYNNTRSSAVFWTFGSEETETPVVVAPTVTTDAATDVDETSVTLNGTVTDTGGDDAATCGFAWGTNSALSGGDTATTSDSMCPTGTGAFFKALTSLASATTYYFRAYATNPEGTGYGTILNFTTATPGGPNRVMRLLGDMRLRGVRLLGL